eukprot:6342296-Prymnesium_polylepis.1
MQNPEADLLAASCGEAAAAEGRELCGAPLDAALRLRSEEPHAAASCEAFDARVHQLLADGHL